MEDLSSSSAFCKSGRPPMSSAKRRIRKFANLNQFAIFGLPQIRTYNNFAPGNTGFHCSNVLKNGLKQACGRILGGFAMEVPKKGSNFLKKGVFLLVLLLFSDFHTGTHKKFADFS